MTLAQSIELGLSMDRCFQKLLIPFSTESKSCMVDFINMKAPLGSMTPKSLTFRHQEPLFW